LALGVKVIKLTVLLYAGITGGLGDEGNDVVERRSKQSAETSSDVVHAHHHPLHRVRRLGVRKLQRCNATESKETGPQFTNDLKTTL